MALKGLKGFANFGVFPTVVDTAAAYSASGTKLTLIGASSCSVNDNREDFSIPGDDGIYDDGSEWKSTDLVPVVHEIDLAQLAALAGCDINTAKTAIEEGTFDIPGAVALVFTALRRDGGYRCYRYYRCRLKGYSVSHSTKGTSTDGQPYTLTFSCLPRKIDGKIRGTEDVADLTAALAWIEAVPTLPAAQG